MSNKNKITCTEVRRSCKTLETAPPERVVDRRVLGTLTALGAATAMLNPEAAQALELVMREEPANALSVATWAIHVSSLIEWLVAMGLVWQYADVCGNPKWKGLTWGMLPLHTSGICACTYHFFYNSPSMEWMVALQAGLTTFGNFTLWWAAYRIYKSMQVEEAEAEVASSGNSNGNNMVTDTKVGASSESFLSSKGLEDLTQAISTKEDWYFVGKLALLSIVGAYVVKYGSLLIDAPFDADNRVALAIIFVPTGFNVAKWLVRSNSSSTYGFGGIGNKMDL